MKNELVPASHQFTWDELAGPIYSHGVIDDSDAYRTARHRDIPRIVEVIVWPYPEEQAGRPQLRCYYALNLPLAIGRAGELEIRLREQDLQFALVDIRPATTTETEAFFKAIDCLKENSPSPDRTPEQPSNQ